MNIWNRFDMRCQLLFSGNAERAARMAVESERVWLGTVPFWGCPTPYDGVVEANTNHSRMCSGAGRININMAHHRAVRTAYELGKRSVLVLEDDVRFLKDVRKLVDIVDALPEDYDVALFDWVQRGKATMEEYRALLARPRVNGYWTEFRDLRSTAFWALSRKGMESWLKRMEAPARGQGKMKLSDQYFADMAEDGLRMYCAVPCAGVQGVTGGMSDGGVMWRKYGWSGMRREDYQEE